MTKYEVHLPANFGLLESILDLIQKGLRKNVFICFCLTSRFTFEEDFPNFAGRLKPFCPTYIAQISQKTKKYFANLEKVN